MVKCFSEYVYSPTNIVFAQSPVTVWRAFKFRMFRMVEAKPKYGG
jgi:hypothetical protein